MKKSIADRGSALIYTLLTLTVISIFLSVIYERVLGLMRSSRDWLWTEKALVAAESGTAAVEARLLDDPVWSAGEGAAPEFRFVLDESEITVRTERFRPPDIVWIFSKGQYKRLKKETVRPVIISDPTLFALLSRKTVHLGMGTIVTGAVFGSNVRTDEGSEVVGSIIAGGELDIAHRNPETFLFDSASLPPIVPELELRRHAKKWPKKLQEETLSGSTLQGGHYVKTGDLVLKDATETSVSIWVSGNLRLEGKVTLRAVPGTDTPVLVVEKDLSGILAGAVISGVIYVRGKVSLKGEGLLTGTLIADEIDLSDGVVVQSFDAVPNEKRPVAAFWKRQVRGIRN